MSRLGLLGSVAALGLLGAASAAQAYETKFGEFEVVFDTTVSVGVSVRTSERDARFLPVVNGGSNLPTQPYNYNPVNYATLVVPDLTPLPFTAGVSTAALGSPVNREGSINGDDGRLNFDSGDLIGGTIKASHDLQVKWRNFTLFTRWFEFYDPVLDNQSVGERSDFSKDVQGTVGRDAKLLDLFLSGNFDLFGENLNVRVGKQVISWGEGTFILNGINVINPIDVNAFRRPGAEIKDGLVPVNSIFASTSLPIPGVSISGFYMLDFEPFEIDAAGTPFSGADVIDQTNLDPRGSINSFLSGSRFSGTFRRNCSVTGSGSRQLAAFVGQAAAYDALIRNQCGSSIFINHDQAIPVGQGEFIKNTFGDENIVTRIADNEAQAGDQYGLRMNWYSDDLGAEFGFYYMNYHSRLPFVSFRANAPRVGLTAQAPDGSASGRATLPAGCLWNAASAATVLGTGFAVVPAQDGYGVTLNDDAFYIAGAPQRALFEATRIADPNNYEGLMAGIVAALAGGDAADIIGDAAASGNGQADLHNLSRINCLLALVNTSASIPGAPPVLHDGAETLTAVNDMSIFLDYPEDIELFGFSFNTTLFGWGVQFEASYRPNAPFQIDTDELTIASAFTQCAAFGIGASSFFFQQVQTSKQYNCPYDNLVDEVPGNEGLLTAAPGDQTLQGYFYNEMFTAQIGTTATFTGSDWWVEGIGADLGVLVTEVGIVHVPGVKDTYIDDRAANLAGTQYQNTGCQGSDLPLGGFLGLRDASSRQCRPTDTSAGYVLLARASYNNAFNTGYVLSPTVVFSHDFYGTTPAPYSNYLQDRMSASVSLNATLNNNFRLDLGYTNFWGGHINNKSTDRDFVSFSASYSF
ncbi:MAG TPA: hypothetical protein DCL54_13535 [Alphaproteobacteria bacterium]|nr:hypothetical protein [Alphaproteobacteria bacterium]HAJ47591.1 hypothetical protein [Alphaproteobacteria bacterium]